MTYNVQVVQAGVDFECEECGHEWTGNPGRQYGHPWETCPNCGADDGLNCWDCGVSEEEFFMGMLMCTDCRRTVCEECTHQHTTSRGREEDGGHCGATTRIL